MPSELMETIDFDIFLEQEEVLQPIKAWHMFMRIVGDLPGIAILRSQTYRHPYTNGMSGVLLLADAHAVIHMWPERGMAWVELATHGNPAALKAFKRKLGI